MEHRTGGARWGRRLAWTAGAAVGAAGVGLLAGAAASLMLARLAVTPSRRAETPVELRRLERQGDQLFAWIAGRDTAAPGQYSFIFDETTPGVFGHAKLGPVLDRRGEFSMRAVIGVDRGELREGARGRLAGWWYLSPEELGFRTERIVYSTELGDAEAWIVSPPRPRRRRWAVHVHGRGALPSETLRGVAPLARAGVTNLVISYRNDPTAPTGEHGRYGNGLAESRDVDAAISEALRRGAERVTLFGWSMGGTAALISGTRGTHAASVDGLILDSPAIDWTEVLRHQAAGFSAPRSVADVGIRMLDRGIVRGGEPGGIDFERLSAEAFARELKVPVLIHASRGDHFVPSDAAERLAAERPDLVQLRLQETGGHVRLWNVAPVPWEAATERFAREIPRPPWRGEH